MTLAEIEEGSVVFIDANAFIYHFMGFARSVCTGATPSRSTTCFPAPPEDQLRC